MAEASTSQTRIPESSTPSDRPSAMTPAQILTYLHAQTIHTSTLRPIMQYRAEHLYVFWEQDHMGLWTSPNQANLDLPIRYSFDINKPSTEFQYFKNPRVVRWYNPRAPYLAFWPLWRNYTGPFQCLSVLDMEFRIRLGEGATYHLDPALASQWYALEDNLINLANSLLARNPPDPYEMNVFVDNLPRACGYTHLFRHTNQALEAAHHSLRAFVPLTAFLSYIIALDMSQHPSLDDVVPSWLAYAVQKGVDPIFVNQIHQSFVCNFSSSLRPGVYVLHFQTTGRRHLAAMVQGNVPLYICWDYRPPWMDPNNHMWRFYPTQQEARDAINMYIERIGDRLGCDVRDNVACWWNMPFFKTFVGPPYPRNPTQPLPPMTTLRPALPYPSRRGGPHSLPQNAYPPPPYIPSSTTNTSENPPTTNSPPPPETYDSNEAITFSPQSPTTSRQGSPGPFAYYANSPTHSRRGSPGPFDYDVDEFSNDQWSRDIEHAKRRIQPAELEALKEKEGQAELMRLDTTSDCPTIGSAMFTWNPSVTPGKFRRVPIGSDAWEISWRQRKPEGRRYVSVYDEWYLGASAVGSTQGHSVTESGFPVDARGVDQPMEEPETPEDSVSQKASGCVVATALDGTTFLYNPDYIPESDYGQSDSSHDDDDDDDDRRTKKRKRASKKQKEPQPPPKRTKFRPASPPPPHSSTSRSVHDEGTSSFLPAPTAAPAPSATTQLIPLIPAPQASWQSVAPTITYHHDFDDVPRLMYLRYGLVVPDPFSPFSPPSPPRKEGTVTTMRLIGCRTFDRDHQVTKYVLDALQFLQERPQMTLFAPAFDFHPSKYARLLQDSYFRYVRASDGHYFIGVQSDLPLSLQWYVLSVKSANVVLELSRGGHNSIASMVRYLLSRGIPFQTARTISGVRKGNADQVPSLGMRPYGYNYSPKEYAEYERLKNDLLRGPCGRAALMYGGIVGRLAREVLGEGFKLVAQQKSMRARKVAEFEGEMYYDDELSPAELDLIVGVYGQFVEHPNQPLSGKGKGKGKQDASKVSGKGKQPEEAPSTDKRNKKILSWFPKLNIWTTSGHNFAGWTEMNESWFQKRLDKLRDGKGQPVGSTGWRQALKDIRAHETKAMMAGMDSISEELLGGGDRHWHNIATPFFNPRS